MGIEDSDATSVDSPDGTDDFNPDNVSDSERTWGILAHASAFVGMIVPMGHILGPLLIWLIKKEESQFIDENGKEAVNFQISMTIYLFVAALLIVILIGLLLVPLLVLAWFVLVILASISASNYEPYRYPATLRLIS